MSLAIPLAFSRRSAACFFRNSLPSSALLFRISRVSSPVFGAKRRPRPTPTPSPRKKFANPSLSIMLSPESHSQYTAFLFQHTECRTPGFSGTLLYRVTSQKRPRKLAAEELFEYAVKCLGARAYSTGDLKSKLRMRAANPADADATIDRLKEIGYLDDQRFAEGYAAARVENEGFGRMRVLNDLRARRVSGEMAEQAVEHAIGERSEAELIDAFIERRM